MNLVTDTDTDAAERESGFPPSWSRVISVVLGVTAVLALVLIAFAWPNISSEPRGVPVAVTGPDAVTEVFETQLETVLGEDSLEIHQVPDSAAAEEAIETREVYAAVVLAPEGAEMLTASAASPAIAQMMVQLAEAVPGEAGGPLSVRDLAPLPEEDPRGVGLTSAVLPLVMGGIIAGVVAALLMGNRGRQLVTVLGIALGGGIVFSGILQGWMGSLAGSYWSNAALLALGMAAISLSMVGLYRLWGRPGLGLVVVTMMLLGNPLSGAGSAPEMLPAGWGEFGQLLPPGATVTALRSISFFEGAGSGLAWTVLAAWALVGLCLVLLTRDRENSRVVGG